MVQIKIFSDADWEIGDDKDIKKYPGGALQKLEAMINKFLVDEKLNKNNLIDIKFSTAGLVGGASEEILSETAVFAIVIYEK